MHLEDGHGKDLENLRKQVHDNPDAQRSGVDLIMGIAALVGQAKDDQQREELLGALKDGADELSEAVGANTPRTVGPGTVGPGATAAAAASEAPSAATADTGSDAAAERPSHLSGE